MTIVQLNQKEQHYAGTRPEAEEVVVKAKENDYLTMHKISEKHNKLGTYFLVDLTYSYAVPKEVMESKPGKEAEQANQHEGVKVTTNGDGQFHVDPNQMSLDDVVDTELGDTDPVEVSVEPNILNDELPF